MTLQNQQNDGGTEVILPHLVPTHHSWQLRQMLQTDVCGRLVTMNRRRGLGLSFVFPCISLPC